MNTPRTYMHAICAFTLGAEDIEEGDLLALSEAEATELLARGFVAPAESPKPPGSHRTLTDPELADMREKMLGWATAPLFTNVFRLACADTAGLIAAHLDGADNAAETAQAVEQIFGNLAPAESDRLARVEALEDRMVEAYRRDDVATWMAAFGQTLDLLSEGRAENLMRYIARMHETEDAPATTIDPALLHAMPAAMQ